LKELYLILHQKSNQLIYVNLFPLILRLEAVFLFDSQNRLYIFSNQRLFASNVAFDL